jgi:hypothetical protein
VDAVLATAVGLSCRSCDTAIEASRVDLVRRLAACARCNRVLALRDGGVAAGRVIPETFEGPAVTSDGSYRERARVVRTTWRHRRPSVEGALTIIGGLLALAICAGLVPLSHPVEEAWVLAAALATIGLFSIYAGVATFVNRCTVSLEGDVFRVRYGPMPWPGCVLVCPDASSAMAVGGGNRAHEPQWEVRILGASRRAHRLLRLPEEEARYLADEISDALEARREGRRVPCSGAPLRASGPLACVRCATPLEATGVDLASGRASCRACDRVFTIEPGSVIVGTRAAIPAGIELVPLAEAPRAEGAPPPLAAWSHRPSTVELVMPLVTSGLIFAVFGLMAAALVVVPRAWPMLFFVVPFLCFGAFLFGWGVHQLFTRDVIAVDATTLTAWSTRASAPSIAIARADVSRLDVQRFRNRFVVRVIDVKARATVLLTLPSEAQARHLADELERSLAT